MRLIYSITLYLLLPFVVVRLLVAGFRHPGYWKGWADRFGFVSRRTSTEGLLWVHAVSVGEVQAARPLIERILQLHPRATVLVTTTTPTGAQMLQLGLGEAVKHLYFPYDLSGVVKRFLERLRPDVLILMETELWPNLTSACSRQGVPIVLANARLSERSMVGYRFFASLTKMTLSQIQVIAAQTAADAERFIELGANAASTTVTGSVKFDVRLHASIGEQAQSIRRWLGPNREIWIAASTHAGEEEIVLDAFSLILQSRPHCLLILVPRHPERCPRVVDLCNRRHFDCVTRSSEQQPSDATKVYLVDTLGELPLFYAASDVAFVGGSMVEIGGHNILEPASLGIPVLTGTYMFNFKEVTELLQNAGAAVVVDGVTELTNQVIHYLGDANARLQSGDSGREIVAANRGAVERVVAALEPLLDETGFGARSDPQGNTGPLVG